MREVQSIVSELLHGRILIGHGLCNDLKALFLSIPRETFKIPTTSELVKGCDSSKEVLHIVFVKPVSSLATQLQNTVIVLHVHHVRA